MVNYQKLFSFHLQLNTRNLLLSCFLKQIKKRLIDFDFMPFFEDGTNLNLPTEIFDTFTKFKEICNEKLNPQK